MAAGAAGGADRAGGIALDAAIQRHPVQDSAEAVSLLANLDGYEVVGGIQSYEDLGLYDLEENDTMLLKVCGITSIWTGWAGITRNSIPAFCRGVAMRHTRSGNRPSHTTASPCRGRTTAGACG
ncbi:MAG: hypothetical protein ACLRNQ_06210 [Flavonifractor plautii]